MKITFKRAAPTDAEALTAVQIRTFDDDSRQHGRGERGGPPGYDSIAWNIGMMRRSAYYKIVADNRIIGGLFVFTLEGGRCELGRIYIDPDYQNQGIGAQALAFIERTFPARRWTLDTPAWATRNQHFYEKHGYVKTGEAVLYGEDFPLVLYEKVMPGHG